MEQGFRKFIVDPKPGRLHYFKIKTPPPHGAVTLEMSSPGRFSLTVPEGTTAVFRNKEYVPGEYPEL